MLSEHMGTRLSEAGYRWSLASVPGSPGDTRVTGLGAWAVAMRNLELPKAQGQRSSPKCLGPLVREESPQPCRSASTLLLSSDFGITWAEGVRNQGGILPDSSGWGGGEVSPPKSPARWAS